MVGELRRGEWTTEYFDDRFERFFLSLSGYQQAVLAAAVAHFLEVYGPDICMGEWGKPLGGGLYEFRVSKSLAAIYSAAGIDRSSEPGDERGVLIRLFCTFYGDKVVLIYHGYDKGRDSSSRRQQKEIAKSRAAHKRWKQTKQ
jgi:hypothetical protein